jgi:hypothetical protein
VVISYHIRFRINSAPCIAPRAAGFFVQEDEPDRIRQRLAE